MSNETDGELSQYLTFEVGGEEYAIVVLDAREILPFSGCTYVPMAPDPVRGLINLRGRAVPILDLDIIFRRGETSISKRSCVVIVGVDDEDEGLMGILTGSVNAVVEISDAEIEPAPAFGTSARASYLRGMAKIGERFVPVLDVARVLSSEALEVVSAYAATASDASDADADASAGTEVGPPGAEA